MEGILKTRWRVPGRNGSGCPRSAEERPWPSISSRGPGKVRNGVFYRRHNQDTNITLCQLFCECEAICRSSKNGMFGVMGKRSRGILHSAPADKVSRTVNITLGTLKHKHVLTVPSLWLRSEGGRANRRYLPLTEGCFFKHVHSFRLKVGQ